MIEHHVCILGGTGFVGHHLINRLAASGHRCRILARQPQRHRGLQLVKGIEVRRADLFEPGALEAQMEGCDTVVNLVGILNETRGRTFRQSHVDLVQRIGEAARATGLSRYLHLSALHADATGGASLYLRTKGEGEDLAHALDGLTVTSFRPCVIFGPGDSFFNRFSALLKTTPWVFPLACAQTKFAPVFVGDLVTAMVGTLADPSSGGKRYDLCGPRVYSLKELVEYTASLIGRQTRVVPLSDFSSRLQARALQLVPGRPFTMDNYLSLQSDSVCAQNALIELGIKPVSIETVAPTYVR